jgi:hypothetical protein
MPVHPQQYAVQFVIPREGFEEHTVAIIEASVTAPILREKMPFLQALRTALTTWARETNRGRQAWKESSHDFNVGDLHEYQDDSSLKRACSHTGIQRLTVKVFMDMTTNWTYDTLLIEEREEPATLVYPATDSASRTTRNTQRR